MPNSINGLKLNKGEWAEFYVMLKLLGEGKLYAADNLLRKNLNYYLSILKIIREEIEGSILEYVIDDDDSSVSVIEKSTGRILQTICQTEFESHANSLFNDLERKKGSSVEAPADVCDFAKLIYVSKPKAPALKSLSREFGGKNDIFIEARDSHTSITSVMGFSIKSQFAQNATLFNAGSSSQFVFGLTNCNDRKMGEFNGIFAVDKNGKRSRGWAKCKQYLSENAIGLQFYQTQNPIYNDNLVLVRESMPAILANCVYDRLISSNDDFNVKETIERISEDNPLNVPNPLVFYEKAMKDFLMAGFTGMTAGRVWDGREQVSGGYIVVMNDGDVLCYHSNDRETFRDYLYRNTHFEYVSCDKYKWGYIEKSIDNGYVLPLNVSIRFNSNTR